MPHLKFAWLQETLSELIHHTTEAGLHAVALHLRAALDAVRHVDAGSSPRAEKVQAATLRMTLKRCQAALNELGEFEAAEDIQRALHRLPDEYGADNVVPIRQAKGTLPH